MLHKSQLYFSTMTTQKCDNFFHVKSPHMTCYSRGNLQPNVIQMGLVLSQYITINGQISVKRPPSERSKSIHGPPTPPVVMYDDFASCASHTPSRQNTENGVNTREKVENCCLSDCSATSSASSRASVLENSLDMTKYLHVYCRSIRTG